MSTHAQANTSAASKQPFEQQIDRLRFRASALKMARSFFDERGLIEVDVPALTTYASIDAYIDLIETKEGSFLHSSPEYALKRLLCEGAKDIYYLGHVFRKEEIGQLHNIEFTMAEWYRTGMSENAFLQEVVDFLVLFLGPLEVETLDFEEALARYAKPIQREKIASNWSEEEKLFYQWAENVEPQLGKGKLTIITNFLPEHAVLAKTHQTPRGLRAKRYEFYYDGIELANGFDELTNPFEHQKRFEESNELRKTLGKCTYPQDTYFLSALKNEGLSENVFGMAAGFDRLLMLKAQAKQLREILPFSSADI